MLDKGIFLILLWLFFLRPALALQEKQFLYYVFTVLTKADIFPEFSAVGIANGRQIKHFSDEERVWVRDGRTVYDWTNTPKDPPDSRDWFIHQLKMLSDCTDSRCSDHVLQRIIGCELEKLPDGSENLTVFDEYGFDGDDFMAFNYDTMQWIDKNPKAKETKKKWDRNTGRNHFIKHYLNTCTDWISKFHKTEKCSPDVQISASKSPDDDSKLVLSCLATGFYPRDVQMNIRRNKYIVEDQISGIRPNHDETFQMKISVEIDSNHEGSYDCQVIHSRLKEPVTVNWDGKCFDCGTEPLSRMSRISIAGAVAVLAVLLLLICWRIYKRFPSRVREKRGAVNEGDEAHLKIMTSLSPHAGVLVGPGREKHVTPLTS